MSPELFKHLWGSGRDDPELVPTAKKLERLKDDMLAKQSAVMPEQALFVRAALDYGVELTRSEYRTLANRNWKIIQKFGVRVMRVLVGFVAVMLMLGVLQLKATTTANDAVNGVQSDRHDSITAKCRSGKAFDNKLRGQIAKLPEPKKSETEQQLGFTEELVSTVVPISQADCERDLHEAGFNK